jgi:hypothetical protein
VVVQQNDFWRNAFGATQGFTHITGLTGHYKTTILHEQGNQPPAKKGVVVDHEQLDWIHGPIVSGLNGAI